MLRVRTFGERQAPERSATVKGEPLMPSQPDLFPDPGPVTTPVDVRSASESTGSDEALTTRSAPVWLQRVSLFVLVLFCVYLGVLVMVLPWWTRIWDHNMLLEAYPAVNAFLHIGAVKGVISGLGLLDIWIGISEAVHYRDFRG